jgi:hypothetical protein
MLITIKRNTGWQGIALKMCIKVNGEKVAMVEEQKKAEVNISRDRAYVQVTQSGIKSNEIEVKDGDILEITSTKLYRMNLPLLIITITIFNILIPNSIHSIIAIIIIGTLDIISLFLFKGFHIKVSEREE